MRKKTFSIPVIQKIILSLLRMGQSDPKASAPGQAGKG
jgi:hypothetical protein